MRSFLPTGVVTAALIALACAAPVQTREIEVLQYDIQTQHAIFSLPCTSCEAAQADLIFDLQPAASIPREGCQDVLDLVLNGQRLDLCFSKAYSRRHITAEASVLLNVSDSSSQHRIVNVTADARSPVEYDQEYDSYQADIVLKVVSVDETLLARPSEVLVQLDVLPEKRLRTLLYHPSPRPISFDKFPQSFTDRQPLREMAKFDKDDLLDIEDELDVLRMLEADAVALQAELAARKLVVNQRLQKHLANVPLKALIEQCDGIMCAAKIVAGRLCDKMGVATESPPDYSEIDTHLQYMIASGDSEKSSEKTKELTESEVPSGHNRTASPRPSTLAGQSVASAEAPTVGTLEGRPQFIGKQSLHNPLVIALEILAGILGLTALCAFIHRKCMSMRTRVERAADKEERRNARAYRRAARRALIRKRWNNFVTSVFCFGTTKEPEPRSYDEKRALILQDAFLEQDVDLAEKGEIMEAQIRELRNAHDIVAGLIGVDEHRYDLARHNPPPHAYFPTTLSRRSTGTLPSYTTESLPDYTSTPDTSDGSGRVADGFVDYTPATSNSDTRFSAGPPNSTGSSSGSRRTRYTPVSSVLAISPRCSSETLRTRQSGDS